MLRVIGPKQEKTVRSSIELVRVLRLVMDHQVWRWRRNHPVSSTCDKSSEVEDFVFSSLMFR
jgi:hypothetical protein